MPIYKGRFVQKENFRAYVYGDNNTKLLVNSWDEFEEALSTGLWFADKPIVSRETPKRRGRKPCQPPDSF